MIKKNIIHYKILCSSVHVQALGLMLVMDHYSIVKLIIITIVIYRIIDLCENSVLLYDTQDTGDTEKINCIFYSLHPTIDYCIRFGGSMSISEKEATCLHGERWEFAKLLEERVSPWDVLSWSSSVEKADDYARVFYNHSETDGENLFLCKCTNGYFGKQCEYTLLFDSLSFSRALRTLFQAHTNPEGRQEWGKILCYKTLECDYGLLCLDWRNICDGQQNCMNGIDEENCDLLEFNECEDNEYRCTNGMCIAEEYWIDGKFNDYTMYK